jgi:hypothetical protein
MYHTKSNHWYLKSKKVQQTQWMKFDPHKWEIEECRQLGNVTIPQMSEMQTQRIDVAQLYRNKNE